MVFGRNEPSYVPDNWHIMGKAKITPDLTGKQVLLKRLEVYAMMQNSESAIGLPIIAKQSLRSVGGCSKSMRSVRLDPSSHQFRVLASARGVGAVVPGCVAMSDTNRNAFRLSPSKDHPRKQVNMTVNDIESSTAE
jgi:hypothetical protein